MLALSKKTGQKKKAEGRGENVKNGEKADSIY